MINAAAELRVARRRAGLTQQELAERTGTSQATISAYENGQRRPSVRTLDRLLAATGSRLVVEHGRQPLLQPSHRQLEHAGRTLVDVLGLADALPSRPKPDLRFPRLDTLRGERE